MSTIVFMNDFKNLIVKPAISYHQSPSSSPVHDILPYSIPLQKPVIIYSGSTVYKSCIALC